MKGVFHRAFKKKENISFQRAVLEENTDFLCNPARGWYQLYTFCVEETPDFVYLESCMDNKENLALVLIDIGAFRSRDLSNDAIANIESIITFFSKQRKDIILRISYDHVGKALEREPSLFSQIVRHLEQIGELLLKFGEEIFIYQGMLIGNWGEMHSSKFVDNDYLERMAAVLEKYKEKTYLAVRCPMHWRGLHGMPQKDELSAERMGLYDDAILGSVTDLGTFGELSKEKTGWGNAWLREEELEFEEKLCCKVPNGGEAVLGDGFWKTLSQEQLLTDLQKMHITYLNRLHDRQLLDAWIKIPYTGKGKWSGKSLYDYIGNHLGYRFWIKDVRVVMLKKHGTQQDCQIEVEIENTGFANLYQEAIVTLEWVDSRGKLQQKELSADLRECDSGTVKCIRYFIDVSAGEVYLSARRKRDGRRIYFANQSDADGRVCLGKLQKLG